MLQTGRTIGPFTEKGIVKLIQEGALGGQERVKKLPAGDWVELGSVGQFYDALLEALQRGRIHNQKVTEMMTEETVIRPSIPEDPEVQKEIVAFFESIGEAPPIELTRTIQGKPTASTPSSQLDPSSAQKPNESKVVGQKSVLQKHLIPLATIVGAISFLAFAIFIPTQKKQGVRLIAPQFGVKGRVEVSEVQPRVVEALRLFARGRPADFLEAQDILVRALEQAAQSLDARGLLCLVHREIWPYTRQSSEDLNSLMIVVRTTRTLDPIGLAGAYCELSRNLVQGRIADARGIVDHALANHKFVKDPILNSIKAEILSFEQKYLDAAAFARAAQQAWSTWYKPIYQQGQFYLLLGQKDAAKQKFLEALEQQPAQKEVRIQFALLLARQFQDPIEARNQLEKVFSDKGLIPRRLEAQGRFLMAQILESQGEKNRALEFAQRAYALHPADSAIRNLVNRLGGSVNLENIPDRHRELIYLGDQYAQAGDCLSAQAEYKAAFEIDTTNALAALRAGKCLWKLNQTSEAIIWTERALRADPKLLEAFTQLSDFLSQRHKFTEASQYLAQAITRFPNHPEVLKSFGLLEYRRQDFRRAEDYLRRALSQFENDIDALILISRILEGQKKFEEAQKFATRALELDSSSHEAAVAYAKNLAAIKGIEAAILFLRDQINKFAYTLEYRVGLAEIYASFDRFRDAQQIFEQVIEVDPSHKVAHLGLANALHQQGRFDQALKTYLATASLDPSDPEPIFKAGILLIEMNRFKEAVDYFNKSIKINPRFPRVYALAGRASYLMGEMKQALEFAEQEKQLNPNLADPYIVSAEVYFALRDFMKCASEYQQAVRLRPAQAKLYIQMSTCYRLAGSTDIAESMLSIAMTLESGNPEIYREQGAIFEVKGDPRSARMSYEKYLSLSPNAPDKQAVEARIQAIAR